MYILYKEPGQFLGTVIPIYTCDGRQICQIEDDTFNYIKGNVKVLEDRMVWKGAPNYGKVKIKYYTNGKDESDLDYEKSSVWTDEVFTTKMHREYTEEEFNVALGLQKIVMTANVEDVFDVRFKTLQKNSLSSSVPILTLTQFSRPNPFKFLTITPLDSIKSVNLCDSVLLLKIIVIKFVTDGIVL